MIVRVFLIFIVYALFTLANIYSHIFFNEPYVKHCGIHWFFIYYDPLSDIYTFHFFLSLLHQSWFSCPKGQLTWFATPVRIHVLFNMWHYALGLIFVDTLLPDSCNLVLFLRLKSNIRFNILSCLLKCYLCCISYQWLFSYSNSMSFLYLVFSGLIFSFHT